MELSFKASYARIDAIVAYSFNPYFNGTFF